jgi:hypothetical protein
MGMRRDQLGIIMSAALLFAWAQGSSRAAEPSAWAAFRHTWATITGYSATVTLFERKGTRVQNSVFSYTFSKPSSATVHFTKGTNAGATVVWGGGSTVVAHRGAGLMGMFKKKFSLHDPRVMTIRGSSIDELSFAAILTHSQGTAGIVSQRPGPMIGGVPTEAVTLVPTSPATDAGLTREIVDISTTSGLPMRIYGYEGATLMRRVDFANVKVQR